ncbi:3902_t:CDS:1, partial [Racocetra persica]
MALMLFRPLTPLPQLLLTHIGSLQDTVAAVASSLNYLEKKTKEYSSDSSCKG